MNIRLDNKVAMVTGAASGIGLACSKLLAESGAKVALVDINPDGLVEATKTVQEKGTARDYQLDVTDAPAIVPTVSRIRQELGEIDILVCSAGINIPRLALEVTEADWDAILTVNTKGLFFSNQAVAVQSMIPRKSGVIVNIASQMGLVGGPKRAPYCASKGGVILLTCSEAVEWAPYNIRVNAVAPTFIRTPLSEKFLSDPEFMSYVMENIPLGRLAKVEDVATSVCFLVSDEANMITGTTLSVDGGWTCK